MFIKTQLCICFLNQCKLYCISISATFSIYQYRANFTECCNNLRQLKHVLPLLKVSFLRVFLYCIKVGFAYSLKTSDTVYCGGIRVDKAHRGSNLGYQLFKWIDQQNSPHQCFTFSTNLKWSSLQLGSGARSLITTMVTGNIIKTEA